MFWDVLKIITLIIVLLFAWLYMRSVIGDVSMLSLMHTDKLVITDAELWDPVSPLQGSVLLEIANGARLSDPQQEYIRITASRSNGELVDLAGWSIQSVVSDTHIYIPQGTLMLQMRRGHNELQDVTLAPGEYAIIKTGRSPIAQYAQSFHTNSCTGYLTQVINFNPKMPMQCPEPDTILPATVENVRTYGGKCIEFLQQADRCTTYTTAMPAELLPACRDLIASKLTYHSCLSEEFNRDGYDIFNNGGWYLYLGLDSEIWRNKYEALRVLDKDGKVVAVMRY